MSSGERLYKTLSKSEFSNIIQIEREYYYISTKDNQKMPVEERELEGSTDDRLVNLEIDKTEDWNPKVEALYLNLSIFIKDANQLFGSNGICGQDAILGIGLSWRANNSRIKHCVKICEFRIDTKEKAFSKDNIKIEELSSNTSFDLFIYVVKPASRGVKPWFANEAGIILYEETAWEIVVQGEGSLFPIVYDTNSEMPLWYYHYNTESEIHTDRFGGENVQIIINKSHSLAPYLIKKSGSYDKNFIYEIISSALTLIIIDIRNEQENNRIDFSQECERGSILQSLKYFKEKLGFDINETYGELSNSIKMFFDGGR